MDFHATKALNVSNIGLISGSTVHCTDMFHSSSVEALEGGKNKVFMTLSADSAVPIPSSDDGKRDGGDGSAEAGAWLLGRRLDNRQEQAQGEAQDPATFHLLQQRSAHEAAATRDSTSLVFMFSF